MEFREEFSRLLEEDLPLERRVEVLARLNTFPITGELLFEAATLLMRKANYVAERALFAVDIVGTGGDGKGLFNISTTAAFIVAGAGIPVIKHGNVGVSGRSGSMDCLQALNVKLPVNSEEALAQFEATGLSFIFAPLFYPSLAKLKPARKVLAERGEKTIFNLLGPLVNPFQPQFQALGVYRLDLVEPFSEAMLHLGREGFVFHSEDSDELLLSDAIQVLEVRGNAINSFHVDIARLGLKPMPCEVLSGGNPGYNAMITLGILKNEELGPKRSVALLNAAMGILAYQHDLSLEEAFHKAEQSLQSGAALRKLEALQ